MAYGVSLASHEGLIGAQRTLILFTNGAIISTNGAIISGFTIADLKKRPILLTVYYTSTHGWLAVVKRGLSYPFALHKYS